MKKSGFTVVELIFVIVILGILTAVAIPKFVALRGDMDAAALSKYVQNAIKEVQGYPLAKGGVVNLSTMSYVIESMIHQNKAKDTNSSFTGWRNAFSTNCITNGRISSVTIGTNVSNSKEDCLQLEVNSSTFCVRFNPNATGNICNRVKSIIRDANYTINNHFLLF